ncbi:hypothetical protein BB560_000925 [Smittium megazygosporum]|uniref:Kinesin motor domain-containing protein n=1 Tax=Smittium megazygosporum TaxID=133381 RepID=A0A2T9ZJ22_9FUNG|nr:hypothetical protein BB560_000925 [Smittium megazygosporum]
MLRAGWIDSDALESRLESYPYFFQDKSKKIFNFNNENRESNIHVVVRCRSLSEKEISQKGESFNSILSLKDNQIVYKNGSNTKEYSFDRVYSPDTEQETLYEEIGKPMLEEVLKGFNCTIFAYGQTGTGKTYTMEGITSRDASNINPTHSQCNTPFAAKETTNSFIKQESGIAPRILFELFNQLDNMSASFDVKVSHLELYNEELRDLLVSNDAEDFASFAESKFNNHKSRLELQDNISGKDGVNIQGLNEILVTNANHAIQLLQSGSRRRQVGSTRCNDTSSRSHSIFTITVRIRENIPGVSGKEIIKIGKFNLVDLAGSENIGRSGAEQKAAREAGMINKSLLTLGRVINSLVDKSPHVPYRESKLTRLLRDSLGGKARACLIATISPSTSNTAETISTLDYALRAKNIKNKPIANVKISQDEIISNLKQKIEHLRKDLAASYQKNGITLSEERYTELVEAIEISEEQIELWKTRTQAREEELRVVNDNAKNLFDKCKHLEMKIVEKDNELVEKDRNIQTLNEHLSSTNLLLTEQKIINKVRSRNEAKIDSTAKTLANVSFKASSIISDSCARFESISNIDKKRIQILENFSQMIQNEISKLTGLVSEIKPKLDTNISDLMLSFQSAVQDVLGSKMQNEIQEINKRAIEYINNNQSAINKGHEEQFLFLKQSLDSLQKKNSDIYNEIQEINHVSSRYFDNLFSELSSQLSNIKAETSSILNETSTSINDLGLGLNSSTSKYYSLCKQFAEDVNSTNAKNLNFINEYKHSLNNFQKEFFDDFKRQKEEIVEFVSSKMEGILEAHVKKWESKKTRHEEDVKAIESGVSTLTGLADEVYNKTNGISEKSTAVYNQVKDNLDVINKGVIENFCKVENLSISTLESAKESSNSSIRRQTTLLDKYTENSEKIVQEVTSNSESFGNNLKSDINLVNSQCLESISQAESVVTLLKNDLLGQTESIISHHNEDINKSVKSIVMESKKSSDSLNSDVLTFSKSMIDADSSKIVSIPPKIESLGIDFANIILPRTKNEDIIVKEIREIGFEKLVSSKADNKIIDSNFDISPDFDNFGSDLVTLEIISNSYEKTMSSDSSKSMESKNSSEHKRKFSNFDEKDKLGQLNAHFPNKRISSGSIKIFIDKSYENIASPQDAGGEYEGDLIKGFKNYEIDGNLDNTVLSPTTSPNVNLVKSEQENINSIRSATTIQGQLEISEKKEPSIKEKGKSFKRISDNLPPTINTERNSRKMGKRRAINPPTTLVRK